MNEGKAPTQAIGSGRKLDLQDIADFPAYSDSFDRSQMAFHMYKMMWLQWNLLTVTLFSYPEGVTVSGEDCMQEQVLMKQQKKEYFSQT